MRLKELHSKRNVTSYKFQFFIHFLTDMFFELNKINHKFQFDFIDITNIASSVDITISLLREHYMDVKFWPDNQPKISPQGGAHWIDLVS